MRKAGRGAPARRLAALAALAVGAAGVAGCATLQRAVMQAPIFELAEGRTSSVRLLGPGIRRPLGGAEIQLWARVENPNPFGFTLSRLAGDLLLSEQHAAEVDLHSGSRSKRGAIP